MSSRGRRSQSQSLNSIESLLLAQSVWELGASQSSWAPIAKILSKHPLLSRPKSFFTPQSCHTLYENLMKDLGLEVNESTTMPHAPLNLQLAQKHYQTRFKELQSLILNEESKFRTVLKEIEDIRAGKWDKDGSSKTDEAQPSNQPSTSVQPTNQPSDEPINESDLGGVMDSTEPDSQTQEETVATDESPVTEGPHKDKTPSAEETESFVQDHEPPASTSQAPKPEEVQQISNEVEETRGTVPIIESPPKTSQPSSPMDVSDEVDVEQVIQHNQIGSPEKSITGTTPQEIISETDQIDQRQEEEEEEARNETLEQEEEETSQQHQENDESPKEVSELPEADITMESGEQEDNLPIPQEAGVETDSEHPQSPTTEVVASELEPVPDDNQSSELEEPVAPTRRSTRRRKSSAASVIPPQTRTRMRTKSRMSESESHAANVAADSEIEVEEDMKEDTPQNEEERTSSPFDGATTRRRDVKRKASFLDNAESPSEKKRLREDSEPVDEEEPGPSSHNTRTRITRHGMRTEEQVALKRFQNVIGMLHSQISQHRNGNIFHNPIKNSEAPDYHEIVKRPMDLKTIKTRVKDGVIGNSLEFQRDIYLMFANAMMYNRPGSDVHAMAEDMMLESEGQINAFRQTEGLVKRGQRP